MSVVNVDIAAVLGTLFGIATSLGIGIIQLNFGLSYMFGLPENTTTQAVLAVLIVIFSAISAVTGVDKGIRRLSEFNMLLALLLLLFVLFTGKTLFLLNALVMNVGDYLSHFISLSMNTYAFDPPTDWLNGWTVFFWAWWIAWGPFVGLFLARISRGRTIRAFVTGTLILPLTFNVVPRPLARISAPVGRKNYARPCVLRPMLHTTDLLEVELHHATSLLWRLGLVVLGA